MKIRLSGVSIKLDLIEAFNHIMPTQVACEHFVFNVVNNSDIC